MLTLKSFSRYLCRLLLLMIVNQSTATSTAGNSSGNVKTVIGHKGSDVTIKCDNPCHIQSLYWTYRLPNGEDEDITGGKQLIRKEMYPLNEMVYSLPNEGCSYNLSLMAIRFSAAGLFICWDGSTEITKTNLIVVDDKKNCSVSTEPLNETVIIDVDTVTITCSLHYSTETSCAVSPLWMDTTKNRNLTTSENGYEVGMVDKHAMLSLTPEADIEVGTRFKLFIVFNCSSFSNNSHDLRQREMYTFGEVPFTFSVRKEGKK